MTLAESFILRAIVAQEKQKEIVLPQNSPCSLSEFVAKECLVLAAGYLTRESLETMERIVSLTNHCK